MTFKPSDPQKSLLLGDNIETTKTAVRVPHQGYYEGTLTAILPKRHDGVGDVDPGGGQVIMCTPFGGGVRTPSSPPSGWDGPSVCPQKDRIEILTPISKPCSRHLFFES